VQDILEGRRTAARQALRPNPNAWQQARPRPVALRPARPVRPSLGEALLRLIEHGAACNARTLFGTAVLAWALALLCVAWLLGVIH
jgi:hypothetical protein